MTESVQILADTHSQMSESTQIPTVIDTKTSESTQIPTDTDGNVTVEDTKETVDDELLNNASLKSIKELLIEHFDVEKSEIEAVIADNGEEILRQLDDSATQILFVSLIKCWALSYVDPKTVLDEETKLSEGRKRGENGENQDEDDEGLEISEAMLAKAAAMARRKQQKKQTVAEKQDERQRRVKSKSPTKGKSGAVAPTAKNHRRKSKSPKKGKAGKKAQQTAQEAVEEPDPVALGMVLYPKSHDSIVVTCNQLPRTTDKVRKFIYLTRKNDDEESTISFERFNCGCIDQPSVVNTVLDCINEITNTTSTSDLHMLTILLYLVAGKTELLDCSTQNCFISLATVKDVTEATLAYTQSFKLTESVEGKLRTGLQDLRLFEKSNLSSALSRWNEVSEKAIKELRTPATKSTETYLSYWCSAIATVKCLQIEVDQYGISSVLSYFETETHVCQRISRTINDLKSTYTDATEAVFGFITIDAELKSLKVRPVYHLFPVLKSLVIKMKLLPLTAPFFSSQQKHLVIQSVLDTILWNLRNLLGLKFSEYPLAEQHDILTQSRDVLADFRLLICETQLEADVNFQQMSTWSFDTKSLFTDSDYACVLCQEISEVLKNLIFLRRFCSHPEFRDFAENPHLRSAQHTLDTVSLNLLKIDFDPLHSSNQPAWVRHIDGIKSSMKSTLELIVTFMTDNCVDINARKYPESIYQFMCCSTIGNTPATVWHFFQTSNITAAIDAKIDQLYTIGKSSSNSLELNEVEQIRSNMLKLNQMAELFSKCSQSNDRQRIFQLQNNCQTAISRLNKCAKSVSDQFCVSASKHLKEFIGSSPVIANSISLQGVELDFVGPTDTQPTVDLLPRVDEFLVNYSVTNGASVALLKSLYKESVKIIQLCRRAETLRQQICAQLINLSLYQVLIRLHKCQKYSDLEENRVFQLLMLSQQFTQCQKIILQRSKSLSLTTATLEEQINQLTSGINVLHTVHNQILTDIEQISTGFIFTTLTESENDFQKVVGSCNNQINEYFGRFAMVYKDVIPKHFEQIAASETTTTESLNNYIQHVNKLFYAALEQQFISTLNAVKVQIQSESGAKVTLEISESSETTTILQPEFEQLAELVDITASKISEIKSWSNNESNSKSTFANSLLSKETVVKSMDSYKRTVAETWVKLGLNCRIMLERLAQIEVTLRQIAIHPNKSDHQEKQPYLYRTIASELRTLSCLNTEIDDLANLHISEGLFQVNFGGQISAIRNTLLDKRIVVKTQLDECCADIIAQISATEKEAENKLASVELEYLKGSLATLTNLKC